MQVMSLECVSARYLLAEDATALCTALAQLAKLRKVTVGSVRVSPYLTYLLSAVGGLTQIR